MKLTTVVLPAYNEAKRIRSTVSEVLAYFDRRQLRCEVIVAADGDDGTREAVREMSSSRADIRVMGSERRCGKGHGIREAVAVAVGDVIGFVDADDKTPISEFDKFDPRLRDGCDVVIGSRAMPGSLIEQAQPLYRRCGSKGFGVFMHVCVGLNDIPDTQCGFKFFRGDVARDLFRRQHIDGYMFDVEVLYLAQQIGYRIAQVPVRWRDDADSRLDLVSGNLRNLRDILSIRWRHRSLAGARPVEAR
ncbi:MAG: glycosyl transferase [Acidobacteria bacterium]|jgi:dolichyl-phosphate beta-glucosyltransferase|nr:glycosyl transferase [Acidobacteriota bacterium]HJN43234.1 dolichyl-phosphate beta-glucosyltransferase [Vicinamibacterales bacterium]|tara:strand:- start:64 stop:804 length:741 start_codon:yes stop_codon:yes gene_type:complete